METTSCNTMDKMTEVGKTTEAVKPADVAQLVQSDGFGNLKTVDGIPLIPMIRTMQPQIEGPPCPVEHLYYQACRNDGITVDSWRKVWIDNLTANAKKYDMNAQSALNEWNKEKYKPVIIAGSGPSLKKNARHLKDRGDLRIVSCSHNFGYLEDLGVMTPDDYYLSLDAGDIVIPEVFEGGKNGDADYYWNLTKDRTLIAYACTQPKMLEKWQGRILFFVNPTPDAEIYNAFSALIDFKQIPCFNVGGNALGACMYMAKAILGCSNIVLVGADFSFDYTHSFHSWKSPYDAKFSGVIPCTDIFGNRLYSWNSYWNFKCWFEYMACGGRGGNPLLMYNATEGGILGAYNEGNIRQIQQVELRNLLYSYNMSNLSADLTKKTGTQMQLLY